jgi:type IV pilus assembly protein PilM
MFKGNFDIPLDFFQTRTPPLIGVDISPSAVKLVELRGGQKKSKKKSDAQSKTTDYVLEGYAIEPLPHDAIVDGNINNLAAISSALQRALKRMGTRVRNAALALPAATVVTKRIFLAGGLREEDLEYQAETEASQYIPFPMDEANLDFQEIGPAADNPEEVEVLLVASRKTNIEDRVAVAQGAGLRAVVVDVESYAAEAALAPVLAQLPNEGKDQCIALVDIGANMMGVNILRNGTSVFTRDQQIGGAQLTRQIQEVFGFTAEEAEAGKRNGGLPNSYERDVLAPFRENIASEVARAIQFFFASTQFNEVSGVVLFGGCAALPGLDHAIAMRTQVPAQIANPFAQMGLSGRIIARQLQVDAPALVVACGLALRRFDSL